MKKADLPEGVEKCRIAYFRLPEEVFDNHSITHIRRNFYNLVQHYVRRDPLFKPSSKGGTCDVVLTIRDKNGKESHAFGHARCSLKDTFCYRTGREIALAHALYNAKKMELL